MVVAVPRVPTYLVAVAATVALALASLPFAHVLEPHAGIAIPMGMAVAAAMELATCAILIVLYAREPRPSTVVLAAGYLVVALLAAAYAGTVPLEPGGAPLFPAPPDAPIALFVVKWVGCAAAIIVYARLRRKEPDAMAERPTRWPVRTLLAAMAGTLAVIALIFRYGDRFPVLVRGERLVLFDAGPLADASSPLALLILLACVAAVIAIFALPVRDGVDAGLTVTAVAVLLEVVLGFVDGRRFVFAWYVARLLCVPASMFVLVGALHDLMRWRLRALDLAGQLAGERRRTERHSRRLETLWKLASRPSVDDESFLRAVLDEAAGALQPGLDMTGAVSHLEGADIVVDVARQGSAGGSVPPAGVRVPIEQTFLADVLRAGGTRSWTNPRSAARPRGLWHVDDAPWQGFVGTPVRVGTTQYFLSFVTSEPIAEPFSPEDHAYVETVAAFCAMRLQQREQLQRLNHQSSHDALTGLHNRAAFRQAATEALMTDARLAVAVVDIDGFRDFNETIGHAAADRLLVEVGAALAARAGDRGIVARLGSDVFAVLLQDIECDADVERDVERLFAVFASPIAVLVDDRVAPVAVTVGIGVATAPRDGADVERLLARAGGAVQTAKAEGGARYAFFDPRVEDAFARGRRLQNDLARALVRREFVLYFQPHVAIADGRVTGAEALIRWQSPDRGLVGPADFVPFAEEHGMLSAITPWIVSETVDAARRWRDVAGPDFRVWFNLSATELRDPDLIERVRVSEETFAGVGVEITESTAMRDVQATARNLAVLRDAGMCVALDDFGTGYSSLAQLKRLPIDVVKIDRSFTAGVPDDPHDVAIVEAVLGLARRYGFNTIAEGVESARQAAYLNEAGCPIAQGFLYAPPLPKADFDEFLRRSRNRVADAPYNRA